MVLAIASVVVMGLATNWMAAGWLAGSILFYVFVYTMWLKRRTPQNIVIGGAAGAFPPVIGWAAVTGSVDLLPLLLFAIVFAWTPPHFWSLSLWAHGDYQRAGVPMLPVVAGAKETRRQIMLYTLVLFPLAVSPWPLGLAGPIYVTYFDSLRMAKSVFRVTVSTTLLVLNMVRSAGYIATGVFRLEDLALVAAAFVPVAVGTLLALVRPPADPDDGNLRRPPLARSVAMTCCSTSEVFSGARNSTPAQAQSASIPRICARFAFIRFRRRAPWAAMDTWSS